MSTDTDPLARILEINLELQRASELRIESFKRDVDFFKREVMDRIESLETIARENASLISDVKARVKNLEDLNPVEQGKEIARLQTKIYIYVSIISGLVVVIPIVIELLKGHLK